MKIYLMPSLLMLACWVGCNSGNIADQTSSSKPVIEEPSPPIAPQIDAKKIVKDEAKSSFKKLAQEYDTALMEVVDTLVCVAELVLGNQANTFAKVYTGFLVRNIDYSISETSSLKYEMTGRITWELGTKTQTQIYQGPESKFTGHSETNGPTWQKMECSFGYADGKWELMKGDSADDIRNWVESYRAGLEEDKSRNWRNIKFILPKSGPLE